MDLQVHEEQLKALTRYGKKVWVPISPSPTTYLVLQRENKDNETNKDGIGDQTISSPAEPTQPIASKHGKQHLQRLQKKVSKLELNKDKEHFWDAAIGWAKEEQTEMAKNNKDCWYKQATMMRKKNHGQGQASYNEASIAR